MRSYDPTIGRFLQPDPSEQEGTRSYVYAGDDPLDASDPSGLAGVCLGPVSFGDCSTNPDLGQVAGGVSLLVGAGAITVAAVVGDAFFPPSAGGNPAEGVTVAGMAAAGLALVRSGLAVARVARLGLAVSGASLGLNGARVLMSSAGGDGGGGTAQDQGDAAAGESASSSPAESKLYKRPGWRKTTVAQAEANAPTNDEGNAICPTCGDPIQDTIQIETRNGPVTRRGFDLDHFPDTWAQRVGQMQQQDEPPLRSEVLDEYNRRVRVQCPACNVSHRFEGVPGEFE